MNATETALLSRPPGVDHPPPTAWTVVVCALVVTGIASRVPTMPTTADGIDSMLFIRSVIRHSIADGRPHWPGYPVYIWLGKLFTAFVGDPILGLHLLSAAASVFTAWPLAVVTRAWALSLGASDSKAAWCGWATAALWLVTPMAWVIGGQILSDPVGLVFGAMLLALCVAGERRGPPAWIAAALVGGLMVGVRLVNVTMLGPVVAEAWRRRRERWRGVPAPFVLLMAGAAGVLPWLVWLAVRDPSALVHGASAHVGGHFQRWGESLWTDHHPLTRPLRAFRTLTVSGLGGTATHGRGVVVSTGWVAVLTIVGASGRWRSPVSRIVGLWAMPHLLYVFVGHDIDYPRYLLSAVAFLCLVGGLAPLRFGRAGIAAVTIAAGAMATVSGPWALRQRRVPPVEIRVERFLAGRAPAALAIVDHSGLQFFLEESHADIVSMQATTENIQAMQQMWESAGREAFTTDPPPQDPAGWVPVAHFCADRLLNPYLIRDLWLFAPVSGPLAGTEPLIDCDED
jgi:hypothetical protein